MCDICRARAGATRRDFLKGALTGAGAIAGGGLLSSASASTHTSTQTQRDMPNHSGEPGRRVLIRGGHVLSMDDTVGDFERGDVLIEGSRIVAVGVNLDAGDAEVIDAAGRIVMPGFIDTHHHLFETALRSFLADGIMFDDGTLEGSPNYMDDILGQLTPVYRPEDVYISELFGSLSQLDAGVTTVMDTSQIHHSPEHSDAAIEGLRDSVRRSVFGYFEGQGERTQYPQDARRIRQQYFSAGEGLSADGLMSMVMGGEIYLPDHETSWALARELDLPLAYHVVGGLDMAETFDEIAASGQIDERHILIHMTGMSDMAWRAVRDAGAHVSLAVPIEMTMRHGTPPLMKTSELGILPSLSSDVECTMTADFFTQMRSTLTLQRMFVNELALQGEEERPSLLTPREVIRYATMGGAKGLRLEHKVGSLTPGKEADILLLDAEAINVAPLNNVPGAVVTLMERNNVETVLVAGRIRKWRGELLEADIPRLRDELTASRDYLFEAAGVDRHLFR
ncbi:amidohydrolase family protein [Halomonas sp. PA5]|nr:amidohydrolase family protein [Halomonas sp. PA5]